MENTDGTEEGRCHGPPRSYASRMELARQGSPRRQAGGRRVPMLPHGAPRAEAAAARGRIWVRIRARGEQPTRTHAAPCGRGQPPPSSATSITAAAHGGASSKHIGPEAMASTTTMNPKTWPRMKWRSAARRRASSPSSRSSASARASPRRCWMTAGFLAVPKGFGRGRCRSAATASPGASVHAPSPERATGRGAFRPFGARIQGQAHRGFPRLRLGHPRPNPSVPSGLVPQYGTRGARKRLRAPRRLPDSGSPLVAALLLGDPTGTRVSVSPAQMSKHERCAPNPPRRSRPG